MKRHESLVPLSREHHPSLLLAQLLKKNAPAYRGMPTDPVSKAAYAVEQFDSSIKQHFSKEEQMLEKLKGLNHAIDLLAAEIIQEHRALTDSFIAIRSSDDLVNDLHTLGNRLEQHIRKEERVLFPLIEQHCPEKMLAEIMLLH